MCYFNLFSTNVPLLYPHKKIFQGGYRSGKLVENVLARFSE